MKTKTINYVYESKIIFSATVGKQLPVKDCDLKDYKKATTEVNGKEYKILQRNIQNDVCTIELC